VGAASWEQPDHGQAEEQDIANSVSSPDPPPNDAIRSWLLRGIHTFGIDPRRLGGRGDARRVLGEDRRLAPGAGGGWRETVSALQRHTIHNALTHLSPEERQVVNLAYLEGRTNRQIAAVLGVSVSTVRRRLWLALDHLDEYVRRTGTWVSSILLLGLVYLIDRAARLGRSASPGEWPHKLAATVAVGTVAAAGVGLVAANQHSSTSQHSPPPAIARLIPSLPGATNSLTTLLPLAPGTAAPITPSIAAVHSSTTPAAKVIKAASNTNNRSRQGDSTSEQSDQVDKSAPVVTVKSDSDRGPAANRSKRGHSRVMTGEDRSDT
jgi:Sigma-70, region 4